MQARGKSKPVLLYDTAVEQAVLGCVLMGALEEVQDFLTPEDFGDPRHAVIYRTCLHLQAAGQEVDAVLVASELERRGLIQKAGGDAYLAELLAAPFVPSQVRAYAEVVKRLAARRKLLRVGRLILELAQNEELEVEEALAKAREQLDRTDSWSAVEPAKFAELVAERIEELKSGKQDVGLVDTGFQDLDVILGGFAPGNLVVLAARPGMGKSSLGLQFAINAAKAGKRVLFFSLEMSPQELVDRVLAWEADLDSVVMRRRTLAPDEAERLWRVWPKTGEWELYVDCSPVLSTAQIAARARRMKTRGGLDLVVIDYLQRIDEPAEKTVSTRNDFIGLVTRRLKSTALDLEVPVIVLSQLNRGVETTQDKRPGLSHLRDSGNIEQDADFVLFIYRRDYYFEDEKQNRGKAEVIVAKQRNGPTGSAFLWFERRLARFRDLPEGVEAQWE